jgi:hypothetical protein
MKKKKILSVLLALFLITPVMHGQKSVDQLFNDFSKEKGVEHVGIGGFTMTFAGLFTDVMGVKGIEVLSFDSCEQSVKDRLTQAIASLKDENYEPFISVNDETGRTKILVKLNENFIRELVVLTTGDDPAIIRIKGKIKPSDVNNVINENKSGKDKK